LAANVPITLDNSRVYDSTSYLTADPATLRAAEERAAAASRLVNGDPEPVEDAEEEEDEEDEDEEMPEAGPSTLPAAKATTSEGTKAVEEEGEAAAAEEDEEEEEEAVPPPPPTAPPRILITTSPGPSKACYQFCDDIKAVFPGGDFFKRPKGRGYELGRVARWATKRGFNAVLVVNEDHKTPSA
jgi:ribosome production factor 1